MANRTMQQKGSKLRRQRRAWAKPLSRASGITPNRGVLGDYKERALGLGVDENEINELIKKLYGREAIEGIAAGRAEVLELMRELKQRVPEMLFFNVLNNCFHHVVCFFNSQKTCYVIAHTDLRKMTTKRSMEYDSKERILHQYYHDKIVWVSCVSIQSG